MTDLPNFFIRSSSARFSCMHANRQGATYKAFLQTQTVTFLDQSILPHSSVLPTSLHGVSLLGMALPSPARTDEVLEKIVGYEKKPTKSSLAAITYPCRHNYLHNCQTASYDHREEKSGQKVVGISDKKLCCWRVEHVIPADKNVWLLREVSVGGEGQQVKVVWPQQYRGGG